ncbi:MAG TPA: tryptophan synthase subunit alpha [Alphaproteobacteria bacterium]|nr:tryptophan synthase subunit alpha [Alphaproteobacteria bacterium]HNS44286.1 tryptophan synthase subunit alpha [Alphaproteobacteria bacterium]
MSRYKFISDKIAGGGHIYMPYVLLGYPDLETSFAVAKTLIESGVHGLEIGFPFRDPAADGPVIEKAGNIAIDNGFKVNDGFALIKKIRALSNDIPLTLMLYYNMVLARGIDKFFADCKDAGVDGVLIPDMPPERADTVLDAARANDVDLVFIAAPTTTAERMDLIASVAGGFIYVVTRMGITGTSEHYSDKLAALFSLIKSKTDLPAIAGFGVSTPEQAQKMIAAGADGVITGSKIVEMTTQNPDLISIHTQDMVKAVKG